MLLPADFAGAAVEGAGGTALGGSPEAQLSPGKSREVEDAGVEGILGLSAASCCVGLPLWLPALSTGKRE